MAASMQQLWRRWQRGSASGGRAWAALQRQLVQQLLLQLTLLLLLLLLLLALQQRQSAAAQSL